MRTSARALGSLALSAALLGGAGARASWARPDAGDPPRPAPQYEGEYGLYVGTVEDGLEVRWVTETATTGVVEAWVGKEKVEAIRTTPGQGHVAHVATLAPVVTLAYGEDGGTLHRTTIRRDPAETPDIDVHGVDSVYMMGDVHGEFDRLTQLLRNAGLIDEALHWTGGDRHLALLGDLFDRGDDVTRVLWFLYGLEPEAAEAGGAVHVILGNHELMIMSRDERYVGLKENTLASVLGLGYGELFDPRTSVLGRWLASKPGLVRMDDLLLAHGGMSPEYVGYTLQEYDDTLRAFIHEELLVHWQDPEFLEAFADTTTLDSAGVFGRYRFFFGPESVQWFRGFVQSDTLGPFLDRVLKTYDASVHVVGHTPVSTIQERYDGKLIAADLLEAATEMLFLSRRDDGGWDRYRIPLAGEWTRLSDPTAVETPDSR